MSNKVYALNNMDSCRMQVVYLGVKVNLEFKNGNLLNGRKATLSTQNPFIQDAIEHDARFGDVIMLLATHETEPPKMVGADRLPPAKGRGRRMRTQAELDAEKKVHKGKGKAAMKGDGKSVVEDVNNINDAIDYFVNLGEVIDGDDGLQELIEKYHVEFPNLK